MYALILIVTAICSPMVLEDDLGRLLALLNARDASLPGAKLQFETRSVSADIVTAESTGTLYLGRGLLQYRRSDIVHGVDRGDLIGSWDGAEARQVRVNPTPGQSRTWPAVERVSDNPYGYFTAVLPLQYGLRFHCKEWSVKLRQSAMVKVLGRSRIRGRDCLGVRFQNGPKGERFTNPVDVWFDDFGSMLAVKTTYYVSTARAYSDKDIQGSTVQAESVTIGDELFFPYVTWEAVEIVELAPALWFPLVGIARVNLAVPSVTTVKLDASESDVGIFDIPVYVLPEGSYTGNVRQGTGHLVDAHAKPIDRLSGVYVAILTDAAASSGCELAAGVLRSYDFHESTCGPNALLMALHLFGRVADLEQIAQAVPNREAMAGVSSLESLRAAAQEFGMRAWPVQMNLETAKSQSRPFIAQVHTLESHSKFEAVTDSHFVTIVPLEAGLRMISPPESQEVLSWDEFKKVWTGRAMLFGHSDADQPQSGSTVTALRSGYMAGSILVLIGFIGVRRLLNRRRNYTVASH